MCPPAGVAISNLGSSSAPTTSGAENVSRSATGSLSGSNASNVWAQAGAKLTTVDAPGEGREE